MASRKRGLITGGIVLAVVIGVVLGGTYGGRALLGSDVGEKCDEDFGCKPHNICISKRCRRSCDVDADCQPDWSCRGTEVSETPGGNAAKGYKLKSINICFSP